MRRTIIYWVATGLVATAALSGGLNYLSATHHAIENFQHIGYPQQLRILLGIAKVAEATVLLLPRLPTLKEWAYAGFTFTWIAATVAHYLAGDGALSLAPVAALSGSLAVSYAMPSREPPRRRRTKWRRRWPRLTPQERGPE